MSYLSKVAVLRLGVSDIPEVPCHYSANDLGKNTHLLSLSLHADIYIKADALHDVL